MRSSPRLRFFRTSGARLQTEVMIQFIDDNKFLYGIELICRVLPIAPSTYHREKYLANNSERYSLRSQHDGFYIGEVKTHLAGQ